MSGVDVFITEKKLKLFDRVQYINNLMTCFDVFTSNSRFSPLNKLCLISQISKGCSQRTSS